MLLFSFICSIVFCFVLLSFTIMLIVSILKQKKINKEADELINGFTTLDLTGVGGADDKEK